MLLWCCDKFAVCAHVPVSAPAHYANARVYARVRNNCVSLFRQHTRLLWLLLSSLIIADSHSLQGKGERERRSEIIISSIIGVIFPALLSVHTAHKCRVNVFSEEGDRRY